MTWTEVIDGDAVWSCEQADVVTWLDGLPSDSVDFVFGSPPYELARLYLEDGQELGIARKTEEWVEWMVTVYKACLRVCKGMVAFVVGHGQTKKFSWSGAPALLCADLIRGGVTLRAPKWFHRVGIPGSGGPDDFRKDVEWIVCATRGGKLPWSDNTACGQVPKFAPGGEMSYRLSDGTRRNQWGHSGTGEAGERRKDGSRGNHKRPSHKMTTKGAFGNRPSKACGREGYKKTYFNGRGQNKHREDENDVEVQDYDPPAIANPGDLISLTVGGGHMGSDLASENEAPFPEQLAERFIRSFCPPGGIVCDPFSGSGTTCKVALTWGRRFIGCDLRQSQVELTRRRVAEVQPVLAGLE